MPESYFAVIRVHGPVWEEGLDHRAQAGWEEHAHFMDDLTARGFIVLGGPLEDGREILIIVQAEDEQAVRATLARDPWEPAGLLRTERVRPWTVLLDSRKA
jgi:uncharacterized protein YciI